jgi:hypothetical protein
MVELSKPEKRDPKEVRRLVNAMKLVAGCKDCGTRAPDAKLQFDHLPGHLKVAGIANMVFRPLDELIAEIAKCEVVCFKCHLARTKARREAGIRVEMHPDTIAKRLAPRRKAMYICNDCGAWTHKTRRPRRDRDVVCQACEVERIKLSKRRSWMRNKAKYRPQAQAS